MNKTFLLLAALLLLACQNDQSELEQFLLKNHKQLLERDLRVSEVIIKRTLLENPKKFSAWAEAKQNVFNTLDSTLDNLSSTTDYAELYTNALHECSEILDPGKEHLQSFIKDYSIPKDSIELFFAFQNAKLFFAEVVLWNTNSSGWNIITLDSNIVVHSDNDISHTLALTAPYYLKDQRDYLINYKIFNINGKAASNKITSGNSYLESILIYVDTNNIESYEVEGEIEMIGSNGIRNLKIPFKRKFP